MSGPSGATMEMAHITRTLPMQCVWHKFRQHRNLLVASLHDTISCLAHRRAWILYASLDGSSSNSVFLQTRMRLTDPTKRM